MPETPNAKRHRALATPSRHVSSLIEAALQLFRP